MSLQDYLNQIKNFDYTLVDEAKEKWNTIAKPLNSLGVLEEHISRIYAINRLNDGKKCVCVFCADNGVVAENVTQSPSEVTAVVAKNITESNAVICNMAKVANAEVFPFDVGMNVEVANVPIHKCKNGTNNFLVSTAMTRQDAEFAIVSGIEIVKKLRDEGYNLIATGEMGIGNTTTSSAICASILGVDASLVSGKGAGLSCLGVKHKAEVINKAIKLHSPNPDDPIDILSKVGGFDIASMCGCFIGGAIYGVPILIDGFISSVSALLAVKLDSRVKEYMIPSHLSNEYAAKAVMDLLEFTPSLNLKMALGEGSGAVSLMPLLDMAKEVFLKMVTFKQANIKEYKPL